MQPKKFRYTLKIDNVEYVLPQAPIGWDEHALRWARSDKYHGLIRSFSLPITFVTDGAKLIRRKLYSESFEGSISLKIEVLSPDTWDYELLDISDLDLSTIVDNGITLECNFADNGIASLIKANENIRYEIDLDQDDEAVMVHVPGIDRAGRADLAAYASESSGIERYIMIGTSEIKKDISSAYLDINEVSQVSSQQQFNFSTSTDWFCRANNNVSIRIKLKFQVFFRQKEPVSWYTLFRINSSVKPNSIVESYVDSDGWINFDFVVSLQSGEKLFLNSIGPIPLLVDLAYSIRGEDSIFEISYALTTSGSDVKALRPYRLFERLVSAMTGINRPVIDSNLLKSDWNNLLITSGDGIRGIRESKIKTSFSDFYKSIDAVCWAGFGVINGIPTIEKRDFFYKKDLLITHVGPVKDFELKIATDFIYSSIKAGYPNKDYERANGREEYNSSQVYSTPVTRLNKELDIQSIYRADQYGIESVRIDREEKNLEKADEKADNDTFFIHVKDLAQNGIYYPIGEENYISIEGISTRSSSYNMGITPKKNLIRHTSSLFSFLQGMRGEVYFASAEKNSDFLTVDLSGVVVGEGFNISISDMSNPLFYPYIAEFECKLNLNTRKNMTENPTGYIIFSHNNRQFMGFILETSVDISRNTSQRYKVLLSPLNNILELI